MPSITINDTMCIKDGLCSTICPLQIILPPQGSVPPEPAPGFDQWCISCGHCVAICPTKAIIHSRINPSQCPDADYGMIPEPDRFEHFLRLRRSTRRFKNKIPEKERIERLISMAGYAPTGHNGQPVQWLIFSGREVLDCLVDLVCDWMKHMLGEMPDSPQAPMFEQIVTKWDQGVDPVLHHAPVLILAHSRILVGTEPTDAAISLGYLDLAALSLGLGGCWAGLFTMAANFWKPLKDFLNLPKGHQLNGAMMVGYPKYKFQRLPNRKKPEIQWR
jgi:nitroreductase/NAD-dependent dihydropyrimidine dehydrogenase PreA subunit